MMLSVGDGEMYRSAIAHASREAFDDNESHDNHEDDDISLVFFFKYNCMLREKKNCVTTRSTLVAFNLTHD